MMKKLVVSLMALGLTLAACKTMEPRPQTPPAEGGGTAPPVPTPPPTQTIPETGTVPTTVPPSTQIIVGYCAPTGQYVATGVNTQTNQFTFTWRGGRATQPAAFARFYESRVPVTVYTSPVRLTAGGPGPAPAPGTPTTGGSSAFAPAPSPPPQPTVGPAPVPTPPPLPNEPPDAVFDPCQTISEDPPPSPKPTGGKAEPTRPTTFQNLAWRTAYAVDAVSDPLAPTTEPVPVPR